LLEKALGNLEVIIFIKNAKANYKIFQSFIPPNR
jgi:hypothetical protein